MDAILKFLPNRVRRLYLGGSGIDRMRGESVPADGYYPEDWIASCIEGNTREFQAPGHGLSKVRFDGEEVRFADLLKKYPADLLGEAHFARYGANPAVLTKFLDSAIRLPVQVHPTVPDAKRYFHADFGKTEAWIILACRPGAYVYCGFNETLDEAVFRRESLAGVYERGLGMMHKIPVKPGEVVIVWGGLPHAIGPGITMVEVMEPSDLTINPEAPLRRAGDRPGKTVRRTRSGDRARHLRIQTPQRGGDPGALPAETRTGRPRLEPADRPRKGPLLRGAGAADRRRTAGGVPGGVFPYRALRRREDLDRRRAAFGGRKRVSPLRPAAMRPLRQRQVRADPPPLARKVGTLFQQGKKSWMVSPPRRAGSPPASISGPRKRRFTCGGTGTPPRSKRISPRWRSTACSCCAASPSGRTSSRSASFAPPTATTSAGGSRRCGSGTNRFPTPKPGGPEWTRSCWSGSKPSPTSRRSTA